MAGILEYGEFGESVHGIGQILSLHKFWKLADIAGTVLLASGKASM